jgi:membrane-associated phospholipid phosphatase
MGLLAVLLVYLWAVGTAPGRWLDQRVYSTVLDGLPIPVRLGLADLSRPVLLVMLAGILAVLAPLALARGWWREIGAAMVVALSVPATVLLRRSVLPPEGVAVDGTNGYPSTHAVVGLAALMSVALLWPRLPGTVERWVLAVLAVVIPAGNVTWYAHRPADVMGSTLLVLALTCLAWGAFAPDLARWWPVRTDDPAEPARSPAVGEQAQQ